MEEKELIREAEKRGYVYGAVIKSPHFPYPLRIGFGLVWSDHQQSLVVGCLGGAAVNKYHSSVPVYEKGEWVQIMEKILTPIT